MPRRRLDRYFIFFLWYSFTFQMFHLAKNVRSTRHSWAPVLQRCFSAVALSDHKELRTMECQNGEKVGNYCKVPKVRTLISLGVINLFLYRYFKRTCRNSVPYWGSILSGRELNRVPCIYGPIHAEYM